jgi:hypothetical protein
MVLDELRCWERKTRGRKGSEGSIAEGERNCKERGFFWFV